MPSFVRKIFLTPRGQWRVSTVVLMALALMIVGFIPLLGLPGAIVIALGDAALQLLGAGYLGYQSFNSLPGNGSDTYQWGAAIIATWLWPVCLVVAHALAFRVLYAQKKWIQWLTFSGILLAWAMAVTWWIISVMILPGR